MIRKGMLRDIKKISSFLASVEMDKAYAESGGRDALLEVIKSAGNIRAILDFQKTIMEGMVRELQGLILDIENTETISIEEEN